MLSGTRQTLICSSRRGLFPARIFNAPLSTEAQQRAPPNLVHEKPVSRTVLSGIQPTGVPHLGNYLGALRQWKDFQDEATSVGRVTPSKSSPQLFYSVVDLHALTGGVSRGDLSRFRKETFASLLAIGLSSPESAIFFQSDVPYHTELMWILSTFASTGYLSRMTQWKAKLQLSPDATLLSEETTEKLKLGLFSYPVLQAADILIYRPDIVPVGEDQAQHIEFARNLARAFNAHFGQLDIKTSADIRSVSGPASRPVFEKLPEPHISPAKRIMSLREPTQKMSKSAPDPRSRILITDSPEEIHAKLKSATSDSEEGITYSPVTRPGVSNWIEILKHISRSELSCEQIASTHANMSKAAFKALVADEIIKSLAGVRDRFHELMQPGNTEMQEAYVHGRFNAKTRAGETMKMVREAVGLNRLDFVPTRQNAGKIQSNVKNNGAGRLVRKVEDELDAQGA